MKELNDKQRKFATLVVSGVAAGRAYEQAGYAATGAAADSCAAKLLRNAKVEDYMAELRKKVENLAVMTIGEATEWLTRAIRTPVGEIDEFSDLAQEVTYETVGGTARGRLKRGQADRGNEQTTEQTEVAKIKGVSKIEALKQLAVMLGWNKPQQVELGFEAALTELFAAIRKKA